MLEKPLIEFLRMAADKTPVPGGGSIAALSGALGCSMAHMSAVFSTSDKFAEVREQVKAIIEHFAGSIGKFAEFIEADAAAYDVYNAALKMPRSTEAEKQLRKTSMQFAIQDAVRVPLEVCALAAHSLQVLAPLVTIGNKNLISDVGVASQMLRAAFFGARLNVEINIAAMDAAEQNAKIVEQLDQWQKDVIAASDAIYSATLSAIRPS